MILWCCCHGRIHRLLMMYDLWSSNCLCWIFIMFRPPASHQRHSCHQMPLASFRVLVVLMFPPIWMKFNHVVMTIYGQTQKRWTQVYMWGAASYVIVALTSTSFTINRFLLCFILQWFFFICWGNFYDYSCIYILDLDSSRWSCIVCQFLTHYAIIFKIICPKVRIYKLILCAVQSQECLSVEIK